MANELWAEEVFRYFFGGCTTFHFDIFVNKKYEKFLEEEFFQTRLSESHLDTTGIISGFNPGRNFDQYMKKILASDFPEEVLSSIIEHSTTKSNLIEDIGPLIKIRSSKDIEEELLMWRMSH